jgi:hypothetical protein
MVPPRFTLWSVGKPWMDASPGSVMVHCDCGVPGRVFSQVTGFGVQAAEADAMDPAHRAAMTTDMCAKEASLRQYRVIV